MVPNPERASKPTARAALRAGDPGLRCARRSIKVLGSEKYMPRTPRTDDELRDASNRVHYSLDMVLGLAALLRHGVADRRASNACLESLAIHARALIDFFDPGQNPRADDVLAQDFFDRPGDWRQPAWSYKVNEYV